MIMGKEISTRVITHKLKIKGHKDKYIDQKVSDVIFARLNDDEKKIIISNPETKFYVNVYKNDVQLIPIGEDDSWFEDRLYVSKLSQSNKEKIRVIWDKRPSERKPTNLKALDNIIKHYEDTPGTY